MLTVYKLIFFSLFFIIQQPSPPIATHTVLKNGGVKAKINCKILWLLDPSDRDPAIAVQNISRYCKDDLRNNV